MKKLLTNIVIVLILSFGLAGCGVTAAKEPIVGKWVSVNSGTYTEFYEDGTLSYTNSNVSELGYLEGIWEANENIPTAIQIDGEDWNVYLFTTEGHTIKADATEENFGNKYLYDDEYGDYYFITNGTEAYGTIGAPNVERIAESGFSDSEKENLHWRKAD